MMNIPAGIIDGVTVGTSLVVCFGRLFRVYESKISIADIFRNHSSSALAHEIIVYLARCGL